MGRWRATSVDTAGRRDVEKRIIPVVVNENVITSRFIYDIPQFVDAIVAQLI
jgi:hypothetical protein